MEHVPFILADPDFYLPIESLADARPQYEVSGLPADWTRSRSRVWTMCVPPQGMTAKHGWKVHVSATFDRAQAVLDIAASVLTAEQIPFKHISNGVFYTWLHHKQGSRAQSGKFIAAYPPDAEAAGRVMELLARKLKDETGPHILSDRPYRDSRVVAYRYGAFAPATRMRPDGIRESLVPDGHGGLVADQRGVTFILPPGITDPFAGDVAPPPPTHHDAIPVREHVSFDGLRFERVLSRSGGGGAYAAVLTATGRQVFVKEARGHTGLHWDSSTATERLEREARVLEQIHAAVPGLAPEPVGYFTRWQNSYLVTEFLPGQSLAAWMVANLPSITVDSLASDYHDYYQRCGSILDQLARQLSRLHDTGYVVGDVNPNNVMVADSGIVRLIDFETAGRIGEPLPIIGTEGFYPRGTHEELARIARTSPRYLDDYGLAAIARFLLGPLYDVARREPAVLMHVKHSLTETVPVPEPMWRQATLFLDWGASTSLPSPQEVAARPDHCLRWLRDRTAAALVAMANPTADVMFPTVPRGYLTNHWSVAYGAAGVLHALRVAGQAPDPALTARLAAASLRDRDDLPPGLFIGTAGIAWVLADYGLLDEANTLLAAADRHPVLRERGTLAEGTAGVALAHLELYRHDRDERHLDQALALRAAIPQEPDITPWLGYNNPTGLANGRPGIALLDHYLAALTGDERTRLRGLGLLLADLDRAAPSGRGGLSFPVSERDKRSFIYLASGAAGFGMVGMRYASDGGHPGDIGHTGDGGERLGAAIRRALASCRTPFTVYSGLFEGRSGLVLALAEHARLTGSASSREAAIHAARRLFCHAVTHPSGVRFTGDRTLRFSADLATGSAGVLLALSVLLDGHTDAFFTLDGLLNDLVLVSRGDVR